MKVPPFDEMVAKAQAKWLYRSHSKQPTLVMLLLDSTGSMLDSKKATIDAVNEYLQGLRRRAAVDGEDYRITLRTFCSCTTKDIITAKPVTETFALAPWQYTPCCNTPLIDATWKAIGQAKRDAATIGTGKVMLVVMTDGQENSSHKHTKEQLAARIKRRQEKGWGVLFLGADINAWDQAGQLGMSGAATLGFRKDKLGETMSSLVDNTYRYTRGYSGPVAASSVNVAFTQQQREQLADEQLDDQTNHKNSQ